MTAPTHDVGMYAVKVTTAAAGKTEGNCCCLLEDLLLLEDGVSGGAGATADMIVNTTKLC